MDTTLFASFAEHYHGLYSLYTGLGIIAATVIGKRLFMLVPTFKAAAQLNADTFRDKMAKPHYAANQKWNQKWAALFLVVIFGLIMPFSVTLEAQPWWRMLRDIVVILFVYDFVYYVTHRFTFHSSRFFKGPLLWMHAIHHRQLNPCRGDSSYIHPLEVAIGLGLFVSTIFGLSFVMGNFHVATVVITWIGFSEINQHNHNLWKWDRFPFKYLNYAARMHHNHHASFDGGNFATISLLYDWMFGTLDRGRDAAGKNTTRESVSAPT